MNEITIAPQQTALTTGDMLAGVLAAARDKSVDVDKLAQMIGLMERIQDRKAREEFYGALNAAQREMPRVAKRGEIKTNGNKVQSRYALLEHVDEAIRPIYERHGFSVTYTGARLEGDKTIYSALLVHSAGHVQEYSMPLALDTSGSKNATQGAGSTQMYARRYLLLDMFNVICEGADTDGNAPQTLSDDQVIHLRDLCRETKIAEPKFAAFYGVDSIEKIPAKLYAAAASVLEQRRAGR